MNEKIRKNIIDRIQLNKYRLEKLDKEFQQACSPKGDSYGTSYEDYDSIHGSRKEFRIEEYYEARKRLLLLIRLDQQICESMHDDIDDNEYLGLLANNEQRVAYCRIVKGYTQEKTARIMGISLRHVQRLEKIINVV